MISRTVVVVHRLSTIQKTETIAVIKNGKVVEQGSYSQLLALGKSGSYYGNDEVAIQPFSLQAKYFDLEEFDTA